MSFLKEYLLVSDFDGVFIDSVYECFFLGYNVYTERFEKLMGSKDHLYNKFRQGRHLARSGGDFFILFYIISKNPDVNFDTVTFEEFISYRDKLPNQIKEFSEAFYNERAKVRKEDFKKWLSLQEPYKDVVDQLPKLKESFRDFIICSSKDRESIRETLKTFSFSCKIYGREDSLYKPDIIKKVAKEYGIPTSKVIFIDDMMENLLAVRKANATVFMASWGYNTPKEQKEAQSLNIPILKPKNIVEQIEKHLLEVTLSR